MEAHGFSSRIINIQKPKGNKPVAHSLRVVREVGNASSFAVDLCENINCELKQRTRVTRDSSSDVWFTCQRDPNLIQACQAICNLAVEAVESRFG